MSFVTIRSHQIKGSGIGSKEIVPTINLAIPPSLILAQGIYAARVVLRFLEGGENRMDAVVHYGNRPVLRDESPSLEVHILNSADLKPYDSEDIQVEIVQFIRNVRDFDSFESLRKQIQEDLSEVRVILNNLSSSL